jgi:hypothetical protein
MAVSCERRTVRQIAESNPQGNGGIADHSTQGRMGLVATFKEEETFRVNQSCDYNKEDNIKNTIVNIAFFVS